MTFYEQEQPLYRIHYYNDFVFKVVKFKRASSSFVRLSDDREGEREDIDGKLSQALSRARSMLLQYALCNRWDYFITITVDPERFDRDDLHGIRKYLAQWVRDYRKQYGSEFKYVLVPELHKKGGWHFHGLVSGIRSDHLSDFILGLHPTDLVRGQYRNFGLLSKAVGFCSLSQIKNLLGASFYMTKYLTKDMVVSGFYEHLYFACRGLHKSRPVSELYHYDSSLEDLLQVESDYCCSGWAIGRDLPLDFLEIVENEEYSVIPKLLPLSDLQIAFAVSSVEEDFEQLKLAGWCNGNMPV